MVLIEQVNQALNSDAIYTELYEKNFDEIARHVKATLGGDPEEVRDFTQDVFVKAYRALPKTLARGDFKGRAWLHQITRRICLDEIRHRKKIRWESTNQLDPDDKVLGST